MALGFCLLNGAIVAPHFTGLLKERPAGSPSLSVDFLNVHTGNLRNDLVRDYPASSSADVLVLAEVSDMWVERLSGLTNTHPFMVLAPRDDNFGIALFSRLPPRRGEIVYLGQAGVPSVEAEFEFNGGLLLLLGTHPLPPIGGERAHLRDEQLAAVARRIRSTAMPVILVGDLNSTPWAPSYQRFVRESGLHDTFGVRGYQPTWPTGRFPLWLPLDHCLVSGDLKVTRRDIGPAVGSDHHPLRVELRLR